MPKLAFRTRAVGFFAVGSLVLAAAATAAPPWAQLVPFRNQPAPVKPAANSSTNAVAAAPTADYSLTERHGPWVIRCASFVDKTDEDGNTNTGEAQAHALAHELRTKHRLNAYIFSQHFDFSQTEVGLGMNRFGGQKKMKAMRPKEFNEIAVMVGNFQSVNDPGLDATLDKIKSLKPASMVPAAQGGQQGLNTQHTSSRFSDFYRGLIFKNDPSKQRGPLGRAFVTRNPLLPDEYFVAKGLDPFVVDMNKSLPYSLLKNPKKYTVKVATFRGVDSMKPKEFESKIKERGGNSRIDEAAEKASLLCAALRRKGVEAYEFHDISESIVTIGSFDSVGDERADGKTEINTEVHNIMKRYSAERINATELGGQQGMKLKEEAGCNYNNKPIAYDAQPMPVEVPRQSLAANYNSTNSALR